LGESPLASAPVFIRGGDAVSLKRPGIADDLLVDVLRYE